jgi:murein DD-endopeptidase MepM/ murein hydrolase activator NlpD
MKLARFYTPIILYMAFSCMGCVATRNAEEKRAVRLQRGIITEDTSYVYALPFEPGKKHMVVQGYFSILSHKNRAAIDIKMKKGTTITAAREGIVVRVKEDGTKGGWQKKYRSEGNVVIIQHNDGSRAGYWHLQHMGALVSVGDKVKKGQPIGLSGKTGLALFPHLHFLVWNNQQGNWKQIPTRFKTSKGIRYLRPFRCFKKTNDLTK